MRVRRSTAALLLAAALAAAPSAWARTPTAAEDLNPEAASGSQARTLVRAPHYMMVAAKMCIRDRLWVLSLVAAGYFFGNIPLVKEHLNNIVLIGLAAAVVPVVGAALFKLLRARRGG